MVGHRGQDGTLLCRLLQARGETLIGLGRREAEVLNGNCAAAAGGVGRGPTIHRRPGAASRPHAHLLPGRSPSFVGTIRRSRRTPARGPGGHGVLVNLQGPIHFLEAMRRHAPLCRFFYASSSLVFGARSASERQDEATQITPQCEYGLMKAAGQLNSPAGCTGRNTGSLPALASFTTMNQLSGP